MTTLHPSVLEWFREILDCADVDGRDVLEVGSYDVNGSVRPLVMECRPRTYLGVDRSDGPGVDAVVDCEQLTDLLGRCCADVVISTEMLEHCSDWQQCVRELVAALRPSGLLLLTTRSLGFDYHCPPDMWRFSWDALLDVFEFHAGFRIECLLKDPQAPGVFLRARKPLDWRGWVDDALDEVDGVTRVIPAW